MGSSAHIKLAATALLAFAGTGCLYLDGINHRPQARVEPDDPDEWSRLAEVRMTAAASFDEDGDSLSYLWAAQACGVDIEGFEKCAPVGAENLSQRGVTADVIIPATVGGLPDVSVDFVRVTVRVTDSAGAASEAGALLPVTNQGPSIALQRQAFRQLEMNDDGTFPFAGFDAPAVIAAFIEDPEEDGIEVESWEVVERPLASDSESFSLAPHPDAPEDVTFRVLYPDVPGQWRVALTARDSLDEITTETIDITFVGDRPPCIELTSPSPGPTAAITSEGIKTFRALVVDDDLDSYNGGARNQLEFRWLLDNGSGFASVGSDAPEFQFDPEAYAPGATAVVRLEVLDRSPGNEPLCPPEQETCAVGAIPGCLQRVSWPVEVL